MTRGWRGSLIVQNTEMVLCRRFADRGVFTRQHACGYRDSIPDASYVLADVDKPGTTVIKGRELATAGLPVVIDKQPGAVIFTYRRDPVLK